MVEKAVRSYYKFFDETLSSSTFLVLLVTMLIFMIGTIGPHANASSAYMKGNVMETKQFTTQKNIIKIDGVEYELQFVRVK
jgi:hypothetical protein